MNTSLNKSSKNKERWKKIVNQKVFYLFLLPGFLSMLIFSYLPLYGLVGAFQDYNPFKGFFASEWIGLDNFRILLSLPDFYRVLFNTVNISFWTFLFGFPAPIILALMINDIANKKLKRISQTISYIPNFISWVVAAGIFYKMLAAEGVINDLLYALGLTDDPIYFLNIKEMFVPIVVITGIWKSVGFSSILYLAVLTGINPELYEAADTDGASKLKKIWYITLPGITPTIILMLVLSISSLLKVNFDQIYTLQNAQNMATSDVLDTYIFRIALQGMPSEYSRGMSFGLFRAVICLFLFLAANTISKKIGSGSVF